MQSVDQTREALALLTRALGLLKSAGALRPAERVKGAIKSTEGLLGMRGAGEQQARKQ